MSPKLQTTVSAAVHSPRAACQCLVHSQPAGTFQRLTDISDLELAVTFLGFSDIIYPQRFIERTLAYLSVRKQNTKKTGEPALQLRNKLASQTGKLPVPELETNTKILFVYP